MHSHQTLPPFFRTKGVACETREDHGRPGDEARSNTPPRPGAKSNLLDSPRLGNLLG